jgi:ADP-ribosylglycohydrolase
MIISSFTFITEKIKSLLLGVAVGDALGVPVEFKSRGLLRKNPVTDMMGYGTHRQPPGTFSDDSSLTYCLAEMLSGEYDLNILARKFIRWLDEGYWTAGGNAFYIPCDHHGLIKEIDARSEQNVLPFFQGCINGGCIIFLRLCYIKIFSESTASSLT